VPFRIAVSADGRCHGLLVDTTWRSAFDLTAMDDGVEAVETEDAELRMWIVAGPSPGEVLDRYTALTGRPVLPPRWALGYHQTRWSYADAAEVRQIARQLREHALPADVIGLDLDHMDRARVFTWSPDRFPRPSELHGELRDAGFRTVAILDCGVAAEPGYAVYEEGIERGYFLRDASGQPVQHHVWPGLAVLPDFARDDVRTWWGDWLRVLTTAGVSGVLVDMNEPSLRDRPIDDPDAEAVELPDDLPHGGADGATHAEVHNAYGALEVRAVAEGLRRLVPDERRLVLTRAGYAGVQRHAGVWTGDNASTWEHLQMSVPQLLNLGLSGIPFAGADVGGFFGHCGPELLVRWLQLGAWYPLMRSNNAKGSVAQEPWVWGQDVLAACRRALELRSRLLPYLGTCLAAAHRVGAPVLRPMWWPQPTDARARGIQDQFLVGPDLLVAPVLQPGVRSRAVYLLSGRWFDWYTGSVHDGPAEVLLAAPLDGPAPLLARAGAVVPVGPVVQWNDQRPLDPLELHVFPGDDGTADGELYEDDGVTHDHERGRWLRTRVHWDGAEMRATTTGSYRPAPRRTDVIVHAADGTVTARSDPAGHLDVGAGDVGGVVAEQEEHRPGDLVQ
jgi:alpha-glucosidase